MRVLWVLIALCPVCLADEGQELFEKRIRPVLVKHCYECHSSAAKDPKGGLRLDTKAGLRDGGDTGPILTPGKPDESPLLDALRHESVKMPPDKKLPADVVADFQKWIELGAVDPRGDTGDADKAGELAWEARYQERLDWWSLQPLAVSSAPDVQDRAWGRQPLDRFILARLESGGLTPAPRADRRTLVRRLSFALTGLPPSPALMQRSLGENVAWESVVDELLASPHFGERWARHWMDVVRYSDTYGYEWDVPARGAWEYRDYLIRAFNADVPFDQLIREQIAGDLLELPRINTAEQLNESRIGVMFYQLGEKRHGDSSEFNGIHQEMLDNKVDAFSKAFQAVTVSCARCHDHKLDAVSQKDYYALAGIFQSSRWVTHTLDTPERHAAVARQLKSLKTELRAALVKVWDEQLSRLPEALTGLAAGTPAEGERAAVLKKVFAPAVDAAVPLESLAGPWVRLSRLVTAGMSVPEAWAAVATEYNTESQSRTKLNAERFTVIADFSQTAAAPGWSLDGVGLSERVRAGDFTVALEGPQAVGMVLPGGVFTHVLSPRMNGALRTPLTSTVGRTFITFEAVGGDFAAGRSVIDNAFLTEKQHYLNLSQLSWHKLSAMREMAGRRVYLELATKTSNPNFPPRVGLGGACSEEQAADPRSWFGVSRVVAHDVDAVPADELTRFVPLFAGEPPPDVASAANRFGQWLRDTLNRWASDKATADDVRLLNAMLISELFTNRSAVSEDIGALVKRYREAETQLATPRTANGMADIDPPLDYRLNIRGDYDQLGDAVPRGWLRMLSGAEDHVSATQSGRRELAEEIASPQNPLTPRVYVNRVWHWLFGSGLVRTNDDFGHLGDRPSHPELLDDLARRFMENGWSTKRLVREIVLSSTWQQAGTVSDRARQADPDNRLRHHMPLRRMDAESIRDAMLFAAGRLDPSPYGPPINPHRSNEDAQKRLFSGPVDSLGRRSIYIKMTIMEPPKFLAAFNQPSPKIPTGRRDVTNTPAQSLALLNDPFSAALAEHWAKQLVVAAHSTVEDRLTEMFDVALSRPPTGAELERWSQAVSDFARLHGSTREDCLPNPAVWRDVAHALFNLKEFIDVR